MLRHIELKVENRECCLLTALILTPVLFLSFGQTSEKKRKWQTLAV